MRLRGEMDTASPSGGEDCEFESHQDRVLHATSSPLRILDVDVLMTPSRAIPDHGRPAGMGWDPHVDLPAVGIWGKNEKNDNNI